MNTETQLRESLRSVLDSGEFRQVDIERETGVPQYTISRFLGGSSLSAKHALPLYEYLSKHKPPTTPSPTQQEDHSS